MNLGNLNELMNNIKVNMVQSGGDKSFDKFKETFSNSIKKAMNNPQNSQFSNENISFSQMDTPNTTEISQKMSSWFIFKIVLGLVIFIILAFNIFTYLKTGSDAFTYYIGSFLSKGKNKVNSIFNKGANLKNTLSSDEIHSSLDLSAKQFSEKEETDDSKLKDIVEKGIIGNKSENNKQDSNYFEDGEESEKGEESEEGEESENKLVNVEEDEETDDPEKKYGKNYKASSFLDLKLTKTAGYCYVGTDRNVRTCVKVKTGDKCASGKVFPTMDICVNPNLKE
jgi:hypothetical protein